MAVVFFGRPNWARRRSIPRNAEGLPSIEQIQNQVTEDQDEQKPRKRNRPRKHIDVRQPREFSSLPSSKRTPLTQISDR